MRYLGLPLLTKRMSDVDYTPLIEKIGNRIRSWTAQFLSHAGRQQLISSVIASITNFWASVFRVPNGCIKDIESLCSAFLWPGLNLNPKKSKMACTKVCRPKMKGGLGLRPLKEVNMHGVLFEADMAINFVKSVPLGEMD